MNAATGLFSSDTAAQLADAAGDIVSGIQRSLVTLHNGRHGVGAGMLWETPSGMGGTFILTNAHVTEQRSFRRGHGRRGQWRETEREQSHPLRAAYPAAASRSVPACSAAPICGW